MGTEIVRELVDGEWKTTVGQGGGAAAAKSYVTAFTTDTPMALTSTFADVVFGFPAGTPDGQAGSDVTLSGDGKTWTLVNDGIYSILIWFDTSNAANDIFQIQILGSFDASDPFTIDSPRNKHVPTDVAVIDQLVVPAMFFTGGGSFKVQCAATLETAQLDGAICLVSRVL